MSRKILWINPVGTDAFDLAIGKMLTEHSLPDTSIEVVSLSHGPHHVEYHFYGAMTLVDILARIATAEADGYHAAIIGCFYDPAVREAKEITTKLVVTGLCEPTIKIASSLGDRFGIIVGRKKWIPKMQENVFNYGFREKLASFESVDMGVYDFGQDPEETYRRIKRAALTSIEQHLADVLILACSAEASFTARLQDELSIPVLDSVRAPLKFAEMLVECSQKCGWQHSKRYDWESPPKAEIQQWDLTRGHGFPDAWPLTDK